MFRLLKSSAFLFLFLISFISYSQVNYGKVSENEMQMKFYSADSTAEAVILSDVGKFDKTTYDFYRHLRVKILKQSGTSWGNWTFNVPSRSSVSGIVYNMENGVLVKEKLKSSSVHAEEVVDDFFIYKVFMPNVKVGSVIDIRYSFSGLPFAWRFQDKIPVKHSELIIEHTQYLDFSFNMFGFEPVKTIIPGHHWEADNMPAFKSEPYLTHYSNYISKVELEVKSFNSINSKYELTTSWEKVNEYLHGNNYIGGALRNMPFVNKFSSSIRKMDLTDQQKIDTVYAFVQKNIKWNGNKSLYVTNSMKGHFLNDKVGNSAEVNLILVGILQRIGLDAYPVAISTRDHGILSPVSPSINKLNYVIGLVKNGDETMLLDATDEDLAPGILPIRCLNGRGRLIGKDFSQWVDISPDMVKNAGNVVVNLEQTDDGFVGKVHRRYLGYEYVDWTKEFNKTGSVSSYTAELEEDFPGIVISEFDYKTDKDKSRIDEEFEIDITDMVDDFGNEIHIPISILLNSDNPFKSPSRKYPVDFIYPFSDQHIVSLKLDENYRVGALPEPLRMSLPESKGSFLFVCNQVGDMIQISCKTSINTPIFVETDYPILQQFYNQAISKVTQSIQIVKKT